MASHSLAIAKASLAAAMIRPDPTSIPKTEIIHFHALLETTLKQCSSRNIQLCKEWLVSNIIPSAARTIAVGKYLVALSVSFKKDANAGDVKSAQDGPSGRRKQLHTLYLFNDLLHHTRHHVESSSDYQIFIANTHPHLVDLIGNAAAYSFDGYANQHKRIKDLLDIWDQNGYYSSSYIVKLRETQANAAKGNYPDTGEGPIGANGNWDDGSASAKRDAPYIMPASHGDPSAPYYDLPAGNMLPHIIPKSTAPINPQLVKPLQFVTGPADESLVTAVKAFLQDLDCLEDAGLGQETMDVDFDELGQSLLRNEVTGDLTEGVGYYGWSRAFCEKMKRRDEGVGLASSPVTRGGNIASSLSPRKRRRYSDSASTRSWSRSSSLDSRDDKRRWDGRRPSSHSRNASREGRQYRSLRSQSWSRSRSLSYSPPPVPFITAQQSQSMNIAPDSAQTPAQPQRGPSPPETAAYSHPFFQMVPPLGPGGYPIPPPRPANYQGQWPPPPPPPPPPPMAKASMPGYSLPLPTGPRLYQNNGPPSHPQGAHPNIQGQMPQNIADWGHSQQPRNGLSGSYPQSGTGGAQPSFIGNGQNNRGKDLGRGGWSR